MMSASEDKDPSSSDSNNVWASLPVPLCDIFFQGIVPRYLNVEDLIRLSGVSRRYHELFSPRLGYGRKILESQLLRDSDWETVSPAQHGAAPFYSCIPQLPTFGTLTQQESIREDPLLVAQLRTAAFRRRALVHIRLHDTEDSVVVARQQTNHRDGENTTTTTNVPDYHEPLDLQMQQITSQYRAKRDTDIMRIARMYHIPPRANTEFLCINMSGRNVWCHWIDHSGRMVIRDGDRITCIQPPTSEQRHYLPSFVVPPDGRLPTNVFRHISQLSHAFAFCWEEGGPPFLFYQQNRSWHRTTTRGVTMPIHAIALHPGGAVEELHCGSTFTFDRGGWFTAGLYQFVDRNTGRPVATAGPAQPPQAVAVAPRPPQGAGATATATEEAIAAVDDEEEDEAPSIERAKELAKTYYGLRVPSIEHECWLRQGGPQEVLGDNGDPLNHPTAISAAIHHHNSQLPQQQQQQQQQQQVGATNNDAARNPRSSNGNA